MGEWLAERTWLEVLGLCAGFFGGVTVSSIALGFAIERALWRRGLRIFAVPLKRAQLRTELIGTLLFLLVFVASMTAAIATGAVRFTSSWAAELVTLPVCWMAFVVYYYALHRALHAKPPLFWIHRWHHESLVTTPLTGFSMHPIEAIGWTLGMIGPGLVLSQLGLLGAWGWLAFFAMHMSGNIVGHANAELFPTNTSKLATLFGNPVTYHSLHHARFDGHYSFASAMMDRLFGTEWPDWPALVARVRSGDALKTLRERGD